MICPICGSKCQVASSDEGTNYYEPIADELAEATLKIIDDTFKPSFGFIISSQERKILDSWNNAVESIRKRFVALGGIAMSFEDDRPNALPCVDWPLWGVWRDKDNAWKPCLECGTLTRWRWPNGGAVCSIECRLNPKEEKME